MIDLKKRFGRDIFKFYNIYFFIFYIYELFFFFLIFFPK